MTYARIAKIDDGEVWIVNVVTISIIYVVMTVVTSCIIRWGFAEDEDDDYGIVLIGLMWPFSAPFFVIIGAMRLIGMIPDLLGKKIKSERERKDGSSK